MLANTSARDRKQLEDAEKALAGIPAEAAEEAKQSRITLLRWFSGLGDVLDSAGAVVDDTWANVAIAAAEKFLASHPDQPQWKKLGDAIGKLSDDDCLNFFRFVLRAAVDRAGSVALMSRQPGSFRWEPTGFHIDMGVKTVNAKIAENPYQSIGAIDATSYIPTEGVKALWSRDFAVSVLVPLQPPFQVSKDAKAAVRGPLSAAELTTIAEAIGWFETDLAEWTSGDEKARAGVEAKVLDSVKLAAIRIPVLDRQLKHQLAEHPELGKFFDNVPPMSLVRSVKEYLCMLRDDAAAQADMAATTLSLRPGSLSDLQADVLSSLLKTLPAEGQVPDGARIQAKLDTAVILIPELDAVLATLPSQTDAVVAVQTAIGWLRTQINPTKAAQ